MGRKLSIAEVFDAQRSILALAHVCGDMNRNIAATTDEQQRSSSQVRTRIQDLNRISGSTAEQGARLAAMSSDISAHTEELRAIAEHFKV